MSSQGGSLSPERGYLSHKRDYWSHEGHVLCPKVSRQSLIWCTSSAFRCQTGQHFEIFNVRHVLHGNLQTNTMYDHQLCHQGLRIAKILDNISTGLFTWRWGTPGR